MTRTRNRTITRWRGSLVLFRGALLCLLVFVQSACVFHQPKKSDPAALVNGIPEYWIGGRYQLDGACVTGWLDDFKSPTLRKLVEEAVDRNYDLGAARARIRQVEERARIAGADRLPTVDAGVGTSRSQNLRGANFQTVRANNFNFSLDFVWQPDLWGQIKDLRDSQLDLLTAETNAYRWARLSLAANVARTAFEIVESREQVALSRENLSSLERTLDILDNKLEAGDADDRTALDISLNRADIARAKSNILVEQRQADGARRTLETLLGRYPKGAVEELKTLPRMTRKVPVGLPSELLLRRPDLVAAESRVDSRLKELSASRKALLPSVRITSAIGTSTTDEFGDLFDIQNMVWNVGQNLTRPLYQAGKLKADVRLSQHELDEIALTYGNTALTAFREVETALAAEWYYREQVAALEVASRESRRAAELSLSQYENGIVEIITLLESQRRAFDSQSFLLAARLEMLRNRVDLYLALGGDFDHAVVTK